MDEAPRSLMSGRGREARQIDAAVAAYRDALKSASEADLMNPLSEQRTRLESLATQLQMSYKTAAELGAITGPDWEIINRVIETPGITSPLKGGVPKLLRQLDEVSNLSKRDRKILDEQYSVVPAVPGTVQQQQPKTRSTTAAVGFLKTQKIDSQAKFDAAVRKLKASGWSDEEIREAANKAGL